MIYLKFPPIEKIQGYKTYGNKYLKFWRNTVTKDDYIAVVLCGERVSFPATQDGVDKAEKWVNEKRAEIAEALKLCEVNNRMNECNNTKDEVRKETAKDIADWLLYRSNLGYPEYCKEIMQNIAKQIKERYGAEGEQ